MGPWVNATSRPIQMRRESLNTSSRCQLSSIRLVSRTTTSDRGESHTAGEEASTSSNTASRSQCLLSLEIGRCETDCGGGELGLLANSSSFAIGECHSIAGKKGSPLEDFRRAVPEKRRPQLAPSLLVIPTVGRTALGGSLRTAEHLLRTPPVSSHKPDVSQRIQRPRTFGCTHFSSQQTV